ncbi:hypothetical protein RvY_11748 [Ramazzottius varieornatus]|uniref:Uncharacterized protein n=1 Tax=Ramazzottius varieornatus TaxID=947166 RepID=A0A1D1VQZ1_RAMVA|nr:hypothetical protein RvY_11748 [Ramazzottius varieornatus]
MDTKTDFSRESFRTFCKKRNDGSSITKTDRPELKQLLEEVALLRKEEEKRHAQGTTSPEKSARKSKGVTEAQQGKDIRKG